jgi:hypothetical protein
MLEETIRNIVREEIKKCLASVPKSEKEGGPEFLNPAGVEKYYGISKGTLANWRCQGDGPAFSKNGRTITYNRKDVEDYIKATRVRRPFQRD